MNSLSEWLQNLEFRHQQIIHLGLENILKVAAHFSLTSFPCTVIHVAGTNGKGSTVALLEAIYSHQGYRVGCYTSPHLCRFNERIRINQCMVSDEMLVNALNVIDSMPDSKNLTYFEMTTLAALWIFKQCALDVMIIEVGLGGRLDATNILNTNLSVITGIALDHQDYLGTDLSSIAKEKAGIIKENIPVIYCDNTERNIFLDVAHKKNAPIYSLAWDMNYEVKGDVWSLIYSGQVIKYPLPKLHIRSAFAACVATRILANKLPVDNESVTHALLNTVNPGRLQWLSEYPNVLIDVAHNEESAIYLSNYLKNYKNKYQCKIYTVFGALKDKSIDKMVSTMSGVIDSWALCSLPSIRGEAPSQLRNYILSLDARIEGEYANPLEAFHTVNSQCASNDIIVIWGSFFTVSDVISNLCPTLYKELV